MYETASSVFMCPPPGHRPSNSQLIALYGFATGEQRHRSPWVILPLAYLLGFERDLRGAPSGDRVFALIGVGAGVVG